MSDELARLRASIDALDEQILRAVNERAAIAKEIGSLKAQNAYRPEREAQVLRRVQEMNPGPLPAEAVALLFRELMSACLALETPIRVTHLGPAGTFSEAAAVKHFGSAATLTPCGGIDEVFRQCEAGIVDFAVVPVENSTEGAVARSLDLMVQTPLKVCGEVMLRIHQHLLVKSPDQSLAAIKRVYSHPQSLAQCDGWLKSNLPRAERVPATSNAEAARLASLEENAAAIAGEAARGRFGLHRLAQDIEDEPNNTTRFLVLGHYLTQPSGKDKTSLVMAARNRPGSIHALLTPFAESRVGMTKLESRPSRTANWEYLFFVDIEGHQQDDRVAAALKQIGERAPMLKVFGSYPVAAL
jgi:chorismate mutase / prephenate dehydratase